MKINQLLESRQQLLERQLRLGQTILSESLDGLIAEQRLVVRGIYNDLLPLIEASLSPEQIQGVFAQVEKDVAAGGGNRTMIGKGVDLAGQANDAINKVGKWLQNTTPVKNFDAKFEKLKNDINKKFPDSKILDMISNMAIYAEQNPGKTAAIIGVLTTIAALAAGPAGGAIAGQILKGSVELLKGEKLSTAIGKGAKAAAFGWLTGKAIDFIGDIIAKPIQVVSDKLNPNIVTTDYTRTIDEIGGKFGNRFGNFTTGPLAGRPEDVNDIVKVYKDAVDSWQEGEYLRADSMFKSAARMTDALSDPEYLAKIGAEQAQSQEWAAAAKGTAEFFSKMGAAAQGAATAATGNNDKKESVHYQTRPLSEGQVYLVFRNVEQLNEGPMDAIKKVGKAVGGAVKGAAGVVGQKLAKAGHNLTNKITADKLNAAWQKAGSPTDSVELAKFLTSQGVDDGVVKNVYATMKIAGPKKAKTTKAAAPADNAAGNEPTDAASANTATPTTTPSGEPTAGLATEPEDDAAQPAAAPAAKINLAKLAKEIKAVQPDITQDVIKLLKTA